MSHTLHTRSMSIASRFLKDSNMQSASVTLNVYIKDSKFGPVIRGRRKATVTAFILPKNSG